MPSIHSIFGVIPSGIKEQTLYSPVIRNVVTEKKMDQRKDRRKIVNVFSIYGFGSG